MSRGRRLSLVTAIFVTTTLYGTAAFAESCCRCVNSADPKAVICIQQTATECNGLEASTPNDGVKKLKCTASLDPGQCRSIINGGVCRDEPVLEKAYVPKPTTPDKVVAGSDDFKLGVPIPGLSFSPVTESGGQVHVPWLAQYVAAIQKYLIVISTVVAAVAIVYGGFRYILGSAAGNIARGKEIVTDAIIGLLLVFGAYLILFTINPDTVSPAVLDIQSIKHKNAFMDAGQERARVVASARVRPKPNADVLVPVIDLDAPLTPLGATPSISAPQTTPGAPTPVTPEPQVGEIAKDPAGNLIAQGRCPESMIEIKKSDAYKRTNVPSFCIDKYEEPDQYGVQPILGVNEYEAEWYCNERGKRLCNEDEWVRACLGPEGINTYGYGPDYVVGRWTQPKSGNNPVPGVKDPAPCNYDQPIPPDVFKSYVGAIFNVVSSFSQNPQNQLSKKLEGSSINPNNPKLKEPAYKKMVDDYYATIKKFDFTVPSGSLPRCKTAEGVFDMVGNTQELVVASNAKNLTTEQRIAKGEAVGAGKPYTWMNGYFNPVAHLANPQATPTCTQQWGSIHPVGNRSYENGFRCCMNLSD